MINYTFTLINDYGQQYGIVLYPDGTYGACNVSHYEPAGNMNPSQPFNPANPLDPNNPTQEGSQLAWATKANNMLGRTFSTFAAAQEQLSEVLGGMKELGQDVFNPAHNPFQNQFTHSDFPDGQTDQEWW
jgi:hypothetical protein